MRRLLLTAPVFAISALAATLVASGSSLLPVRHVRATMPGVGGTLTLRDQTYGSTARITLLRVIDPATPSYPSRLRPHAGDRWVATRISIRGVRGSWVDGPSGDGRLIDSHNHRYRAFPSGYGTVEPRIPGTTDLTPGQLVQGNLVFELPKSARPRWFKYFVQGGDTGTWKLSR